MSCLLQGCFPYLMMWFHHHSVIIVGLGFGVALIQVRCELTSSLQCDKKHTHACTNHACKHQPCTRTHARRHSRTHTHIHTHILATTYTFIGLKYIKYVNISRWLLTTLARVLIYHNPNRWLNLAGPILYFVEGRWYSMVNSTN